VREEPIKFGTDLRYGSRRKRFFLWRRI